MQKFFILGICNVFLFFNLIPNGYSESQIYENQDFGFMIEYPYDWILNDTLPQTNKWNEIVSIVPPTEEWSQGIYVNKWIGDLKNKMFDSSAYLEAHNKAAKEWCSSISIEENGFGCTNYVLVDQKTISVSGRESFLLEENWIRIDDTGNSTVTVYNLQIPDGDDRWTVIGEGKQQLLSENNDILKNSLASFTLLNPPKSEHISKNILSPKFQIKNNVPLNEISCKEKLILIFKASDGTPACVKPLSLEKLLQRGWTSHDNLANLP